MRTQQLPNTRLLSLCFAIGRDFLFIHIGTAELLFKLCAAFYDIGIIYVTHVNGEATADIVPTRSEGTTASNQLCVMRALP